MILPYVYFGAKNIFRKSLDILKNMLYNKTTECKFKSDSYVQYIFEGAVPCYLRFLSDLYVHGPIIPYHSYPSQYVKKRHSEFPDRIAVFSCTQKNGEQPPSKMTGLFSV